MPVSVIAKRLVVGVIAIACAYFWCRPTGQRLFVGSSQHAFGPVLYPIFFWIWTGAAACFYLRWALGTRHSPNLELAPKAKSPTRRRAANR